MLYAAQTLAQFAAYSQGHMKKVDERTAVEGTPFEGQQ